MTYRLFNATPGARDMVVYAEFTDKDRCNPHHLSVSVFETGEAVLDLGDGISCLLTSEDRRQLAALLLGYRTEAQLEAVLPGLAKVLTAGADR